MELGTEMEKMHRAVTAEQCSHVFKRKEIRIPNKKAICEASYHIHIERVASGLELLDNERIRNHGPDPNRRKPKKRSPPMAWTA